MQELQNPIVLAIMPCLHFLALKYTKRSFIASVPFIILALAIPLAKDQDRGCNPYLMALFLGIALRTMDSATLDTKDLSFNEYIEYFVAFKHPSKPKHTLDIAYEKLTMSHFAKVSIGFMIKFCIYFGVIKYFRRYRPIWNPKEMVLFDPQDPFGMFYSYSLGWALCMLMDVIVTCFMYFNSFVFKTPFIPIMNQPYLATSVRDFWSNRWNLIVQRGFKSSIFEPILKLFGHDIPCKRVPHWQLVLAGLVTFLFSALLHEWTLMVLVSRPSAREQFVFFTFHGLWTILEVSVRKLFLRYAQVDLTIAIPKPVQIVYTHCVFLITSPLFMNPYIREQLYFKVGFA